MRVRDQKTKGEDGKTGSECLRQAGNVWLLYRVQKSGKSGMRVQSYEAVLCCTHLLESEGWRSQLGCCYEGSSLLRVLVISEILEAPSASFIDGFTS